MDPWLAKAAAELGSEELTDADVHTLLDLARLAAHESGDRTNAPLLCYLVGAARASGRSLDELADAVRRSTS